MKKFATSVSAAAAALTLAVPMAMAASPSSPTTGQFDVNITLNTKCEINSSNTTSNVAITGLDMTYTSFQTTDATGSTSFNVRCTNSLPYAMSLDTTAVQDNATDLNYTVSFSSSSVSGSTGSLTGTGANQSYTVYGKIASGQAGTCTSTGGSCTNTSATNKTRTVTVAY